jgi:hypothetical protein
MRILACASNMPCIRTDYASPPKRVTIRDRLAGHHAGQMPRHALAEDIRAAHVITVADKPTLRTGVVPALGFVAMPTLGACLAGIGFVDQFRISLGNV